MSSPKPIQIPPPSNVKFSKTGRAYADMDSLIDRELARIKQTIQKEREARANGGSESNNKSRSQGASE